MTARQSSSVGGVVSSIRLSPYRLPFRKPVTTARGIFTHRAGYIIAISSSHSFIGYGEISTWPGFCSLSGIHEDIATAHKGIEEILASKECFQQLNGHVINSIEDITLMRDSDLYASLPAEIWSGVELAMLDLLAKHRAIPLAQLFAPSLSDADLIQGVPLASGIALTSVSLGGNLLGNKYSYSALKVKITGEDIYGEVSSIIALCRILKNKNLPQVRLRLDCNGCFNYDKALLFSEQLDAAFTASSAVSSDQIAWIEQPLAVDNLASFKKLITEQPFLLALDESVSFGANNGVDWVRELPRNCIWVVKPPFVGGLLRASEIISDGAKVGVVCQLSSPWESMVGRTAACHLALATYKNNDDGQKTGIQAGGGALAVGATSPFSHELTDFFGGGVETGQGCMVLPLVSGLGIGGIRDARVVIK